MILSVFAINAIAVTANAEVNHYQKSSLRKMTYVEDEAWQPEGFENGITVPAVFVSRANIILDGKDDEPAWYGAPEVPLELAFGTVEKAWVRAIYTEDEVYIRVRWPDSTESRHHHPWTWDETAQKYVPGSQVEDSLLLSFESGCEWTPSLLGGYQYDFDGWHWMAARTDPLGQALDTLGTVTDRVRPGFVKYASRVENDDWQMKFVDVAENKLHASWDQLERVYLLTPVTKDLYIGAMPDGGSFDLQFVEQIEAPAQRPPEGAESRTFPQFRPIKLYGDAGEISAKGNWQDGFWTVEFRRQLKTPLGGIWDMNFVRLTQFSLHVLDQQEGFDKVSESPRLFLEFMESQEPLLASESRDAAGAE